MQAPSCYLLPPDARLTSLLQIIRIIQFVHTHPITQVTITSVKENIPKHVQGYCELFCNSYFKYNSQSTNKTMTLKPLHSQVPY